MRKGKEEQVNSLEPGKKIALKIKESKAKKDLEVARVAVKL